jgi:hypothetical protein
MLLCVNCDMLCVNCDMLLCVNCDMLLCVNCDILLCVNCDMLCVNCDILLCMNPQGKPKGIYFSTEVVVMRTYCSRGNNGRLVVIITVLMRLC